MKATLIFLGVTLGGWGNFGKVGSSEANFVQYGLAYISAYAKKEGHDLDLIDLRKLHGWEEFELEIAKRSPGIFGISSMSVDFGVALDAIKRIKVISKDSIVILGGVHATVAIEELGKIDQIDYIIIGEGEISFSQLLSKIEEGSSEQRIIKGISPDINSLPYPDRDIFDYENGELLHPWLPHMETPFVSIITSRGCPFRCTFCQPAERMVFGGKAKNRMLANIIEELKFLRQRYKFKSLLIHDDLFTFNRKWILEFCRMYREEGFAQPFTCQARVDFIVKNEDVVKKMVESGLSCFMIGFESGSQRILDFLKKGTTVEQNRQAAEICKKYNIKIFANYMFGIPTETFDEVRETVKFIRHIKPYHPSPSYLTPYPGTELYNYCVKNNLILKGSYEYYDRSPRRKGKLEGIDYNFLKAAVMRSMDYERGHLLSTESNESWLIKIFHKSISIIKAELNGKSPLRASKSPLRAISEIIAAFALSFNTLVLH